MKRKESHWEHEEEIISDTGKTGKKNWNALTKFQNQVNVVFL